MSTPEIPTFDEWFQRKYGTTFEFAHMQPYMLQTDAVKAFLEYSRSYLSEIARSAHQS